jgi:DNA mismatch repair protein MutL
VGRIRRLPDSVANQIAAGEVVERPASVVKELVENAIDAGAKRIEVELEGGGVELIRVTDDGSGMSRDDALLCLERHATSKIERAEDLLRVETMGFRGEALPSIASVSRFVLTTRARDDAEGSRVAVEGTSAPNVSSVGAPAGTTVEVRDLFFNLPARRKFLKQPSTEVAHVSEAIERLALMWTGLAFRLTHGGRTILDVPEQALADPHGRLGRILGREVAEKLHRIQAPGPGEEVAGIEVTGYLSSPDLSERTARGLRVFVNGRFVRDRTIQHAVQDAYRTLLERGRYPVVLLYLEIEPGLVDVNVHPQKIEVRFQDTQAVHRATGRAMVRPLAQQPWLGGIGLLRPPPPGAAGAPADPAFGLSAPALRRYTLRSDPSDAPHDFSEHQSRVARALATFGSRMVPGASTSRDGPSAVQEELPAPAGRFSALEPIGQVLGTYLVCQGPGRMVLIDQHAAHERVAFEKMRRQHRQGRVEVQPLLVPRSIELDPIRAETAAAEAARLEGMGLELAPFGGSTWLLKTVPRALSGADVEGVLLDVLDELKDVGATNSAAEVLDASLSCAACHTVVRANDRLGREEIAALLREMDQIDFGAHCPHGRPVFAEWSEHELARLFHRT